MKIQTVICDNSKNERRDSTTSTNFLRVDDVAKELGVSKSYAYKIVRRLNEELEEKGILTISGRVNRQYFNERLCYETETRAAERM